MITVSRQQAAVECSHYATVRRGATFSTYPDGHRTSSYASPAQCTRNRHAAIAATPANSLHDKPVRTFTLGRDICCNNRICCARIGATAGATTEGYTNRPRSTTG